MFIIYGNVNLVPGKYDAWQTAFSDLKPHVVANESKSTLTYYFGVPEECSPAISDTTYMLAFEAYTTRAGLYDIHLNSAPMSKFLAAVPPTMTTGLDLTHYEDVAGFLDRSGDMRECAIFHDLRITTVPGKRAEVLRRLSALADWVHTVEDGTYTFLVLKSLDRDDQVRVFERYGTKKAMRAHQSADEVIGFYMGSKELIVSLEGRGFVPTGTGWLHR